jgi:CelD/BcsL family acetyltransferase involved in cellulose biosynthesis
MSLSLALVDARDPRVERTWRLLEAHTHPTYFLSWGWVESWLAALPAAQLPPLAVISDRGAPCAAFFLGRRAKRHHLVATTTALYLNATGSDRHDGLCVEHNGLLAAPGACRSLAGLVALLPGDWDELHLPAIDRHAFADLGAPGPGVRVRVERELAAPFVDLDAVRGVAGGYVALLGAGTRTQLLHVRRIVGDLRVEVASDDDHALDIYGELLRLHARTCRADGKRGAFADPWIERFHRRLIEQRLRHGEIQLVRVGAAGRTLGCLYHFVFRGRVLFYQSGFATFDDRAVAADALCHAAAIEHNAAAGHAIYDLRAGSAQQLATGASRIAWVCVQRPRLRFALEELAGRWKQALASAPARLALRPG